MKPVITTENLSKNYGRLKAVSNVSINVGQGEIYGFLGLNGAGKTTTIRMLLGMIKPTSGSAYLNGIKITPGNNAIWKDVGYIVEVPYSYPDLTVRENLELVRKLRSISDPVSVDNIIDSLNLGNYSNVPARNLSLGNAQRLGLAKAMIHNPSVLILDEPANGLDPAGIIEIREMLTGLAAKNGVTVFISSHILGEISRFATRIGIIHDGVLLHESSATEIENLRKVCLEVRTADNKSAACILREKGFEEVSAVDSIIEIRDRGAIEHPEKVNGHLVSAGFTPSLLKVEEEDLESFFLRVISMKGGVK